MKKFVISASMMLLLAACGEESKENDEANTKEKKPDAELSTESSNKDVESYDVPKKETLEPIDEEAPQPVENEPLTVYLDDPDETGTNLRKSPNGEVVMTLVKDDINMDYMLTVVEAKDGWFRVTGPIEGIEHDFDIPGNEAWIHGSVISVDTRNYGNQTIELLSSPVDGTLMATISEETGGLKILDMSGSWVQVEYDGTVAWIEARWLCGNPLTTCS